MKKITVDGKTINLYDVEEASKKLLLSNTTVRNYIWQGKISGKKYGNKWYVTEETINKFLKKNLY